MYPIRTTTLLFCLLTFQQAAFTQSILLSLSGGYGALKEAHYTNAYEQTSNSVSVQLGLEAKLSRRFSIGACLDWQFLEPELDIALPILSTYPDPPVSYSINRHQVNARCGIHYYFSEAFRGLYLGAFGALAYQTVTTQDYPTGSHYYSAYKDPNDHGYLGGGVTYGYRFKITPKFRLSASGTHQLSDGTLFTQLNHRWGLGIDWVF